LQIINNNGTTKIDANQIKKLIDINLVPNITLKNKFEYGFNILNYDIILEWNAEFIYNSYSENKDELEFIQSKVLSSKMYIKNPRISSKN
jgi:hypothetical protein